ncbi:helix-turn-helix domain-containing protein [Methylobacterium goesingense]|uniref:Transcriptional regulator with XRE-family HTH domain n=1 Tax=Methylobacterium goesingense TaxID=243690 RepID=A0ABV2L8S0_9HYPH|nr:helix-turn-helix transcriptional regulator [Methylobacterium goesingense]
MTQKHATADDRTLGIRITALRKARGLSQTQVGKALGVSFQQVQKYERGTNRIGAGRLQAIANLFEVPVSSLYGDVDDTAEESEIFGLIALPGAVDLLRAFAKIDNADLRRNVLAIASTAARISTGPVAGNG